MSTVLAVTSQGLVLPSQDGQTPLAHVLTDPGSQSLEAALAEWQDLLDRYGYVVVPFSTATSTAMVRRMHTVRSLLESDRIALVPSPLPPLGLAVLVRQLRQLSRFDFPPGVLGTAVRMLAYYVHAGAMLNTVAKLDHVPVSLKAHAKSWMPGSQFGVLAHPEPQLVKIAPGASLRGPEYATTMVMAKGQLATEWVRELATTWPVQALEEVDVPQESAKWWGTGKLVEFTAAIPDVGTLHQLVSSVRRQRCRWCGVELLGESCAFCSAPLVPPENQVSSGGVVHNSA
ncbi:hypothetical protein [Streptomyces sp. NPDC005438]|uniref:hypothetical protein n=1 Tax=Streptomyces sp. NPDC005438 TaxID=3156880 RepID=UPI0033A2DA60